MAEKLNVAARNSLGTSSTRRLRNAGHVPAELYGHGAENVHLTIPAEEINSAIRHGSKLVELTGVVNESALIRSVQWDAFGVDVLHLDLTRVKAGQRVPITVAIVLRGEAPGLRAGGVVDHVLHQVEVECPVIAIPDKLEINTNSLELGQSITLDQVELPEGTVLLVPGEQIVVQCVEAPVDEEEGVAASGDAAEPEVIGRKADDEEAAGDD